MTTQMNVSRRTFRTFDGLHIAADEAGAPDAPPVVLLHGIGQTRFSWKSLMLPLAGAGFHAISCDLRGHGESDWEAAGDYELTSLVLDLRGILAELGRPTILVGASMGGIIGLLAEGESEQRLLDRLVLVDVSPRVRMEGAERILSFMTGKPEGFGSVEEVAQAVAQYNPHRPVPDSLDGLKRNLRERDGRFFWHWDPAFVAARDRDDETTWERIQAAVRHVDVPTRLVHGAKSDLVGEEEVRYFRELMPTLDYVDVAGAGHMIAGDRNDAFQSAVLDFLGPRSPREADCLAGNTARAE